MVAEAEMQIGGRIKRLRRQKKVSQADLAQALGISASYLNLIEHNRRKVTVPLLFSLAGQLGVEPGELVDSDEGRLVGDLMEAFGDDLFADSDIAISKSAISRNPTPRRRGRFCGFTIAIGCWAAPGRRRSM